MNTIHPGILPKILVVDDVPENIEVLSAALERDYDIQFALNGEQALRLARENPPDLMLLDVMMPGMDGYETCRQAKADPRLGHLPVIFVTALGEQEAEAQGLVLGAVDYITKPINVDIARLRIRNQIERIRLLKEVEAHRERLEELVAERTAELVASESRFRGLVEQSLAGIFVLRQGLVCYANPGFAKIYGFESPASMLGQTLISERVATEDQGRLQDRLRRHEEGGLDEIRLELTGLSQDGQRIFLEMHAHTIEWEGGRALIGLVLDITERKRAEIARESALAAAEHLAALKNQFSTNMSHELKTPLSEVIGLAEVGRRTPDLERARNMCRRILDSGRRLVGIIETVLDFSEVERGRLTIEHKPCNLAGLIEAVALPAQDWAQSKGVNFEIVQAPDLPTACIGDAKRLTQILQQLLGNAVKFTERGKVSFRIRPEGGQLVFVIEDSGIGMTPEQLRQAFRPFEQVDGGLSRRFGGMGLGLALAQRLAERMGGQIRSESWLGAGSRFELWFPLVSVNAQSKTVAPDIHHLPGHRVLLAVDNDIHRMLLEAILTDEGIDVTSAEDWPTVVGYLYDKNFDLLIADLGMMEEDAPSLLNKIHHHAPKLPLLLLSWDSATEARPLPMDGIETLTIDTFDPAILVHSVQTALARTFDRGEPRP